MHVEAQIPQNYHWFALFHSSHVGNLMTPVVPQHALKKKNMLRQPSHMFF